MTIGADLNNPFDLKVSPYWRWQGEIIGETGLDDGFCKFDTLLNGLRAGFKDLLNAWRNDDLRTIRALVYHWAPPNENDSEAYLSGVCRSTGWQPDDDPQLDNPARLAVLGRAFLIEEQGNDYVAALDPQQLALATADALA